MVTQKASGNEGGGVCDLSAAEPSVLVRRGGWPLLMSDLTNLALLLGKLQGRQSLWNIKQTLRWCAQGTAWDDDGRLYSIGTSRHVTDVEGYIPNQCLGQARSKLPADCEYELDRSATVPSERGGRTNWPH